MESKTNETGTFTAANADLIINGGSLAAVAAALAAAESGRQVILITPKTYLGDDITAFLRHTENPGELTTVLARRIYSDGIPTPMHIKETLERELLHAGVRICYGCHPGGILESEDGSLAGIAMLSRAGRHIIRANSIIDASWTGLLARQMECRFRDEQPQTITCLWRLAAPSRPEDAESAGSLLWNFDENSSRKIPLWQHSFQHILNLDSPASLASLETETRRRFFRPDQFFAAENVFFVPHRHIDTAFRQTGVCSAANFELRAMQAAPALWVLSPAIDADKEALATILTPGSSIELGLRLGYHLAENLPKTTGAPLHLRSRNTVPVSGIRLDGRDIRGATAPSAAAISLPQNVPVFETVDVLVAGCGTAGAPAAIAAAREKQHTLVLEALNGPGGVGTWGQISRYYCGYRKGFTAEVDAGVAAMGTEDMQPAKGWRVEWKKQWWINSLLDAGAQLWPDTVACGVQVQDNRVTGVIFAGPCGWGLIPAGCVVDSSGAADLVAAAGGKVVQPGKEQAAVQGTGLSPREPEHDYDNSDHTFSDDGDVVDITRSFIAARRKFRERFDLAPILSTRERRRAVTDVVLQPEDVLTKRSWPDALHLAVSSFDTHGFTIHPLFTLIPPPRHEKFKAVVPLRALLPAGLEGILVTGLGIGAHRDVMPVVRMQPCVQNQGYAVGLVAAAAVSKKTAIRQLDLISIQNRLIKMEIIDEPARADDPFPLSDDKIASALSSLPLTHKAAAILLSHPESALPQIRSALKQTADPANLLQLATLLGLMGDKTGSPILAAELAQRSWDQGWNFRGMHQFEASRSPLDSLLWAAAGAPAKELYQPVLSLTQKLSEWHRLNLQLELSHAQAIAAACSALIEFDADKQFAPLLARMLLSDQVAGNHQSDWDAVFSDQPRSINYNESRNRALRELSLAAGLFKCGDLQGCARRVLLKYARDWRGPLAHHAKAVLEYHQ